MSRIQYTDAMVSDAAAQYKLREGWYKFVITDAEATVSSNDHYMLVMTCSALEDENDIDSKKGPSIKNRLVLPFANTDVDGHEGPNTTGFCVNFTRAVLGLDYAPYYPRRDAKTGKLTFNGKEISDEEAAAKRQEIIKKVYDKVIGWYDDPASLVNLTHYGRVEHSGDFAQMADVSASLPKNTELVPPGHFVVKG